MKCIGVAAAALIAMLAGIGTSSAGTFTVTSTSSFAAHTTGAVTTDFNGVTGLDFPNPPCPGASSCFAGFNPLVVNGISFSTTPGDHVNVNTAHYYDAPGVTDLSNQYIVNSETHFVTIDLPSAVTAFGIDFGTLFDASTADFSLSNGFTKTGVPTLGSLQTQFLGFISDVAFNQITLTVPNSSSFVVADVTTAVAATPIPAALPLFASALAGLGFVGYRRKRLQPAA